ncbi:MAG: hypothetical protein KGJ12_05645 [Gammaproteobacteria bacterium]|nr:hypothetical protein [Gammaproteobacteria bacterium]
MQTDHHPYLEKFNGSFQGVLRWPQLDALWDVLRRRADCGWYVYAVGETPPATPADARQLITYLGEIDPLLRKEHGQDYCGIVYVDDPADPTFVKIYDPNNLGVVCGYSEHPPLPGWTLSLLPPVDLPAALPAPANRRRWWRRLFPG